jgi:hypothetical protein
MRKLLLFLIALASIALGVCSPASAQTNIIGSGMWGDAKPSGGGGGNVSWTPTASPAILAACLGIIEVGYRLPIKSVPTG